jgi:hypothetical protein
LEVDGVAGGGEQHAAPRAARAPATWRSLTGDGNINRAAAVELASVMIIRAASR